MKIGDLKMISKRVF